MPYIRKIEKLSCPISGCGRATLAPGIVEMLDVKRTRFQSETNRFPKVKTTGKAVMCPVQPVCFYPTRQVRSLCVRGMELSLDEYGRKPTEDC